MGDYIAEYMIGVMKRILFYSYCLDSVEVYGGVYGL